ncbi:hypothetical protein L484_008402 [Morus notabilis]|uniref:WAT1-related protein n=1 Tax=Morus notabilis TaxID=981085 RepID=W9SGT4_9ROSA|nr:hypothetical protein L484_008402 [Morus notabilis]
MLSISGALMAVLYKGPTIISSASSSPSPRSPPSLQYPLETTQTNGITGGLLLVLQSLFSSIWYILQTQVIEMYPDEQIVSSIYFLCKTIIALPICFIAEAKWSHWTVKPDKALVTIVVSGVFGPSYDALLSTWVVHLKGPPYASIFKPFSIAIAAAFSVIFLGDSLFLGRYITVPLLLQVDSED